MLPIKHSTAFEWIKNCHFFDWDIQKCFIGSGCQKFIQIAQLGFFVYFIEIVTQWFLALISILMPLFLILQYGK